VVEVVVVVVVVEEAEERGIILIGEFLLEVKSIEKSTSSSSNATSFKKCSGMLFALTGSDGRERGGKVTEMSAWDEASIGERDGEGDRSWISACFWLGSISLTSSVSSTGIKRGEAEEGGPEEGDGGGEDEKSFFIAEMALE